MNYFSIKIPCERIWASDWKIETKYYETLKNHNTFTSISPHNLERVILSKHTETLKPGPFCYEREILVEYEGDVPPSDLIKIKLIN